MEKQDEQNEKKVVKKINQGRDRTNILWNLEQKIIAFLVQRIPSWMSSDMLTAIGFIGNIIVSLSFILAAFMHLNWLLLGLPGFMISWFGDSLDGRLAYYRNNPHKWYGFSLDLTIDWLGTFLIGLGFTIYAENWAKILGFVFVVLYGWEIIMTLMRYKITGKYKIDSGMLGPTEVRLILALIMTIEVFIPGSITWIGFLACLILFVTNILDFKELLKLAYELDEKGKTNSEK